MVNRYKNTYVSFCFKFWPKPDCTGLIGENRVFQPVKKKLEKHTTKNEKSRENVIVTAFSLATFSVSPSCSTVLVLQPSSYPYFFTVLHVFLVGVLKIWLEGMPTSALLNAKVKKILPSSHFVCLLFYFGKSQNIVLFLKIKVIDLLMFLLYLYLLKFLLIIQFFDKFI